MSAISSDDGGFGLGRRFDGKRTAGSGLYGIQPHRTAAVSAPEMMAWIDLTLDAA